MIRCEVIFGEELLGEEICAKHSVTNIANDECQRKSDSTYFEAAGCCAETINVSSVGGLQLDIVWSLKALLRRRG